MIKINGWISLEASTDGEESLTKETILQIDELLRSHNSFNQLFELISLNGSYSVLIAIDHNHNLDCIELVTTLVNDICKLAKASYGVIYFREPEAEVDYNTFKVLKIAKGVVSIENDTLLSPCNPIIED